MNISLENNLIVFTIHNDSINLKPLLHFVENNFINIKNFSSNILIFTQEQENIKKQYLLKWAYKVYAKKHSFINDSFLNQLMSYSHLPIRIRRMDYKALSKTVTITIEQISSSEVEIVCNQYHLEVIRHLKNIFHKSLIDTKDKKIFRLAIYTKQELSILKELLSNKKIYDVSVKFITRGLSFKKMHADESDSTNSVYMQRLKKSYEILSVSFESELTEVKNSYRRMLRKYHPDRVYNQTDDLIKLYTKRFQVVQNAYAIIKEHHENRLLS